MKPLLWILILASMTPALQRQLALAADSPNCATCTKGTEPPELKPVESSKNFFGKIAERFTQPEKTKKRVFDGIFLFDIEKDPSGVSVTSVNTGYDPNWANTLGLPEIPFPPGYLGGLYPAALGASPSAYWAPPEGAVSDFSPAQNFNESLALIRKHASKLSREDKLYFLNRIGEELSEGYDDSATGGGLLKAKKTSLEQVFQNLKVGGTQGGVCRDIAAYLAEVARALGFESVGTHTGLNGEGQEAGAHVVTHFKDPKTGEYYMQNYSKIFNTHQKTLPAAIDVSTRVIGALTGVTYVESLPGKVHQYTPKLSRWIQDKIDSHAERQEDPAYVTAKISNNETTLGLQYQVKSAERDSDKMVKGFFLRSQVETTEGPVRIQAIGVAGDVSKNIALSQSVLDEVGYAAKGQFGFLELKDRKLDPTGDLGNQKRRNVFLGGSLAGKARINQTTGKLEFETKLLDLWKKKSVGAPFSGIANKLTPSVEYQVAKLPVAIAAGRTFEVVPRDQNSKASIQSAYDKIGIVVDRRGTEDQVAVISNSEAYLFGGTEKRDAIALRQLFAVTIPTEKKGEFAVIMDLSKIVENRDKDPFYDLPLSAKIRGEWKMALKKLIEIGTGVEARYGSQPFFLFDQPGSVTPDLATPKKKEVKGDLWLRMKF